MASTNPKSLDPIVRRTMESGVITKGAVSENRMPESAVTEGLNMHFDTIGAATLRKGQTLLGNNVTNTILGMHYHVDQAGTYSQILIAENTVVRYLSGGTWTSKRTALTANKARFVTYLNYVFMVNGAQATAIWDGNPANSFVTTGNASNAPIGKFIENFRSRVWIAGNSTYPDRVYFSSIPSSVTTPVISWDTDVATGQWIDISPSDGENITALQRFRTAMIVFKTDHLYRLFDIGQTDPDPFYNVGTSSQESIVETKSGLYFHHRTGFYIYNIDGRVQEISRPITDIVKVISPSWYQHVTGWVEQDGDHVCWSVGSVSYEGVTYTNMVVRYTISTQVWTCYDYPTRIRASLRRAPYYTDGTTVFSLVGDTSGNVLEHDTGVTDNGTPIKYSVTHRWENLDALLSTNKIIMIGNFSHTGGAGSTVSVQTEENDPYSLTDWKRTIGQLKDYNTTFSTLDIKARKLRFRVFGSSTGQPFVLHGYELIGVLNEYLQPPE